MNSVVVVESPAKAKTIEGYLGDSYSVVASFGHVRDMADKDGAVKPGTWSDITWSLNEKGKKQIKEIQSLIKNADHFDYNHTTLIINETHDNTASNKLAVPMMLLLRTDKGVVKPACTFA